MNGPFPRLFPRLRPVSDSERKALEVQTPSNGNGNHPLVLNRKQNLLPRGVSSVYEFFSPDGGHTIIDLSTMQNMHLAFVAYWFVAMRWRAQKLAEAPIMVVAEDQDTGTEDWIADHDLADILEMPSPDYDMGELIERTSRYLDNTAECIWTIDRARNGLPGRLTPFKKGEFEVQSDGERLYATFKVNTARGRETFDATEVCYFRDHTDTWTMGGKSRLDVAMAWLRLGERSRQTIRDLLDNSIWPSAVVIPDKDWNPDPETLEQYKQDLENYGSPGMQGRPFVQLGGGSFTQLAAKIRDLVPAEVLDRVESVVAAVSGVPAIVLQFQIGLVNSPWSQMAQARQMAYDDTIQPQWRKMERVLTRQLLRPIDEDKTHFIRFDRSQVESLQEDQLVGTQIANLMGRAASLNERRSKMGLDPVSDPKADEIPELTQPDPLSLLAGAGAGSQDDTEDDPNADDTTDEPTPRRTQPSADDEDAQKRYRRILQSKATVIGLNTALKASALTPMQIVVKRLLSEDADAIAELATVYITPPPPEDAKFALKARGKEGMMTAVLGYLRTESTPKWARATTPLLIQAAQRSTAVIAADLSINYNLLSDSVIKFAQKEAGAYIQAVSKTTRQLVSDIVAGGIEERKTSSEIANLIRDAAGFDDARAELIARTETARAFNGAPTESLKDLSRSTGREFWKTWSTALDDRVRDEHAAMEGETVPIDEAFSNGSQFPDDPNERCTILLTEAEE